jgi:hypothetical protein
MRCEQCREALSARLDGEDTPAERVDADRHMNGCPACQRWFDDAAKVTRLARMSLATTTGPVGGWFPGGHSSQTGTGPRFRPLCCEKPCRALRGYP